MGTNDDTFGVVGFEARAEHRVRVRISVRDRIPSPLIDDHWAIRFRVPRAGVRAAVRFNLANDIAAWDTERAPG